MTPDQEQLYTTYIDQNLFRRRKLLPVWIKIFLWIFLVMSAFIPYCIIVGLLGMDANLGLYGLETLEPFSMIGIALMILFLLKGIVAFGLWWEKEWAVNLAIIDAILGIVICGYVMLIMPFLNDGGFTLNLRLELVALIPYLIKMQNIKDRWMQSESDSIAIPPPVS